MLFRFSYCDDFMQKIISQWPFSVSFWTVICFLLFVCGSINSVIHSVYLVLNCIFIFSVSVLYFLIKHVQPNKQTTFWCYMYCCGATDDHDIQHNENVFLLLFSFFPVSYNGELYIFGGYNAHLDRHFNDLWKFNPGEELCIYIILGEVDHVAVQKFCSLCYSWQCFFPSCIVILFLTFQHFWMFTSALAVLNHVDPLLRVMQTFLLYLIASSSVLW